jgi:hypothetical protein
MSLQSFDWPGLSQKINNMVLDVKQAVEENRKRGWLFLGVMAIALVGIALLLKLRR